MSVHSLLRAAFVPTAVAFVLALTTAASAAPGDLDPSFSGDGMRLVDAGGNELALSVLVQADGRIVVGGVEISALGHFCLARLKPRGGIDTSFSGDGVVTFDFTDGALDDAVQAVAQLPNGKLVAIGSAATAGAPLSTMAVARLLTNGELDLDFSGDGKARVAFPGESAFATAAAIQGDGKILIAGAVSDPAGQERDFAVARLRRNGSLDFAYGEQGRVRTDFGSGDDVIQWMGLQDDGKLVVGGTTVADGAVVKTAFARYTASGDLDTSFGGDGKRVLNMVRAFGEVRGGGLEIRSDGKIVAGLPGAGPERSSSGEPVRGRTRSPQAGRRARCHVQRRREEGLDPARRRGGDRGHGPGRGREARRERLVLDRRGLRGQVQAERRAGSDLR